VKDENFIAIVLILAVCGCSKSGQFFVPIKYQKICLEGHVYYSVDSLMVAAPIVIALDDDGKPIKCKE
jgi:hypothetical protein